MPHRVTVERYALRFAAAHFATFGGDCEPLHGHNYDVLIEVEGELTGDSWVVDFRELKSVARDLCKQLDHKFLLQRDSNVLQIEEGPSSWKVCFAERSWVFPASDVMALPIDNSTAERLAQWFVGRLRERLDVVRATNVTSITVGIEEQPGQAGWFSERC